MGWIRDRLTAWQLEESGLVTEKKFSTLAAVKEFIQKENEKQINAAIAARKDSNGK